MHAESERRGQGRTLRGRSPRVVILDAGDRAQVEVLELPDDAALGTEFRHCGRCWHIIGLRPGSRVLIAEPEQN